MPPFTRLVIPDLLLAEVIEHARRERPLECCGLLAGSIVDGVGTVTTRFELNNDAASATEYLSNARDMLFAFRTMRERGLELLAIYHSHPTSEPVPSRRDIERNTYGETAVHVIVGLGAAEPVVRAWWLTETDYREAEWGSCD
ncbi:MAG: M67 family metallopeptidase [Planctomycetes bacterium]|nr:M67 family metallopeptidase [Planctomycetota bacterium]